MPAFTENSSISSRDMRIETTRPLPVRVESIVNVAGILGNGLAEGLGVSIMPDESDVASEPSSSDPSLTIEGITLNASSSPVVTDVSTDSETVSIIQDATSDAIKEKILNSTIGPQPTILSSVKMPSLNARDMDDALEVSQFEKQIVKEAIMMGLESVAKLDPKGTFTSAKTRNKQDLDILNEQIDALSYLQTTANIAASGLDILRMSPQIMERATDAVGPLIDDSENSNDPLPQNIDDYISLTFPDETVRLGVDSYLTNTSRLIVIAQDMMQSALSVHPTLLQFFSRDARSQDVLFSTPGSYSYDPDGPGVGSPSSAVPTVSQVFAQNDASIVNQFIVSRRASAGSAGAIRDNNRNDRQLLGGAAQSVDEKWDSVLHLVTCLSNEMILSAGIGRLLGSRLGTRFIEPSSINTQQYDPFIRVLGFSPVSKSGEISSFYTSGPARRGSYLDYLSLGEEVERRSFIVMPFETSTAVYNSTPYVAGKKYFIDLAIQNSNIDTIRSSLKRFSEQYTQFTADMSSYLTELLSLKDPTNLAPQTLLSRILQDFKTSLGALDVESSQIDKKSAYALSLFALVGHETDLQTRFYLNLRRQDLPFTVLDILKMSVIKALKDLDRQLTDKSYVLSSEKTDYSTITSEDSADSNLKFALKSISSNLPVAVDDVFDDLSVSRVNFKFDDNEFLHASSFSNSDNIVNLIARTIREIQKESLNLSQKNGAKSDYRNSSKNTFMSDCDEDRLVDVICDIYSKIAYLVTPISANQGTFDFSDSSTRNALVKYSRSLMQVSSILLDTIISSIVNGTDISPDYIQQLTSIDPETQINVGGNNTAVCTSSDIIRACSRVAKHRYYIKSSLKILEAVSAGIASASSKMATVLDILGNNVKREKLKGLDVVLYDMFVTNSQTYQELLENISEQQINLCTAARSLCLSDSEISLRKDIDTSTSERLALRDFIKSLYGTSELGLDDLHLISVGIPKGMIESLYQPSFFLENSDEGQLASLGNEGQRRGRLIRVEVDRYDNVKHNSATSAFIDVLSNPTQMMTEFDPEIFILPDSIKYNPEKIPEGSLDAVDAIFRSTDFYRIRSGKVIEKTEGSLLNSAVARVYMNALRSYLFDLYLYETIRIRYLDGLGHAGAPKMTKEGFELTRLMSNDDRISASVLNRKSFIKLFDNTSYSLKAGESLRDRLTPRVRGTTPEFSMTDVKMGAVLSSMSPIASISGAVRSRPYERVYSFLYDENFVRNNMLHGDIIDDVSKRRLFDIFSLSLRVSYGGAI